MSLPIKLKPIRLTYSLVTAFFLNTALFYPGIAEDNTTTLGDLSARIEDLENQLNAKEGKIDDANPGARVSRDDLETLKDDMRSLHDNINRLQKENSELRSEMASKRAAPSIDEPFEEKPISKRKGATLPSLEKDEETESVLKLLEQSAPGEDEGDESGPSKKKSKKDLEEIRETATKHAEETAPNLPAGNAEAQYNEAFALHDKGAYKEAERAFDYFITTYPNDPLVSKAMYWKAESRMEQGNHKGAQILFVNAYKKNPKGPKAPDCLLKLGETLAILGKKESACIAWRKLTTDFPHMTNDTKNELTALKKKYGCDQKSEQASSPVPKN